MGRNKHRHRHDRPNSSSPSSPPVVTESASEFEPAASETEVATETIASAPLDGDEPAECESAAASDSSIDAVAAFSEALHEKDELIAALTSQLEETVEQLDRLHRQGADRMSPRSSGPAAGFGGDPQTTDRLNQWLDQWDERQPIDVWTRIEQRIEELANHLGSHPNAHSHHEPAPLAALIATPDAAPQAPLSWEETKRRMLGELADPEPALIAEPGPAAEIAVPEEPVSTAQVEYPAAVDLETADRPQLAQAIETRDRYISYLTHRLRASEMRQPVDWHALNQAPADLRQQLEDLENRYREHLRREECEMALERARLAREQARLQQDRHRLEQQMRRSGINADDYKTPAPAGRNGDEDRSWLNVFGRKK